MRGALFAVGWFSLLGQVVLLRELGVAFFGVELLVVVSLGAWLLASAVGAAAWRPRPPRRAHLRAAFIAAAWLIPLSIAATRGARTLLDAVPGALLPLGTQLALCLALVAPLAWLAGAAFQWAARHPRAPSLTAAYAWESAGALVAGVVATLTTLLGGANLTLGLCGSAGALAAALWPAPRPAWLWPVGGTTLLAILFTALAPLDAALTGLNHPGLVHSHDSAYGRITITRQAEQLVVFENDALAHDSQSVAAEELVHLAALAHPAPRRVLILGGAGENLPGLALAHAPTTVDQIELDRTTTELLAGFLPPLRAALDDPRVALREADPRAWLERDATYDLVLVAQHEPLSAQANRLFTRELFARLAARLAPGGVVALRLRTADTTWSEPMRARNASIAQALAAVFPHTRALPGQALILLASSAPLPADAAPLVERLAARGVDARLISPPYLAYLFDNPRAAQVARALADPAALNTDDAPACYRYTTSLWLTQLWPDAGRWLARDAGPAWGPLLAALALLALLLRRSPAGRRLGLAFVAGFVGLVLESAILLAYQVSRGVLYRDLGLLLTSFMVGLTVGAAAVATLQRTSPVLARRAAGLAAAALLTIPAAWLGYGAASGAGLPVAAVAMALGGAGVAGLFATAGAAAGGADRVAGTYAADLGGGGLGALAGGLFFVPFLGLSGTGAVALAAALLAGLLAFDRR